MTCFYRGATGSVLLQVRDGAVYFAEPGSPARLEQDVTDLGEDAHMDNAFHAGEEEAAHPAELLEMARLVSSRLP